MKSLSGFSLMELLIAVGIVAIIATILFPVFARGREKARQATCISTERQIGMAIGQYEDDNDGFYPMMEYVNATTNQPIDWTDSIYPYFKRGVSRLTPPVEDTVSHGCGLGGGIGSCPSFPVANTNEYGINWELSRNGSGTSEQLNGGPEWKVTLINRTQVHRPAETVMLVEKGAAATNPVVAIDQKLQHVDFDRVFFDPREHNFTNNIGPIVDGFPSGTDTHNELAYDFDCKPLSTAANCATFDTSPGDMPRFRHFGRSNMLFCDGHVEAVRRGGLDWYKSIYIPGVYESLPGNPGGPT